MKNKKLIAGLAAVGMLAVGFAAYLGISGGKGTGLDPENTRRALAEIQNEKFSYFDSEAVALSSMSDTDTGLRAIAYDAYQQVNDERTSAGLDELKWDKNLETVSSVRAQECSQSFSHTRPDGRPWYTVNSKVQGGENLAFGFDSADDAVEAWMNSPTHRDNILYDEFAKVAISIYEDDGGTCYWAQEYGY